MGYATGLSAKDQAGSLDFADIELWPDFDRASVLVLLTGALPSDAPLPATVTLPIPEDAEINAVARMDNLGGLFTDIDFDDTQPGQITLNLTEPVFRIEYYIPYRSDGEQRDYSF